MVHVRILLQPVRRTSNMNIKPYIIILSVSFGIMIAGAVIGNALEAFRIISVKSIGPKTIVVLKIIYFILFCLMAFSAVPLFVRAFIVLQRRIGNAEMFLIKWLSGHEQAVVWCFWGIFVLGLIIIFTLARDDVLSQLK